MNPTLSLALGLLNVAVPGALTIVADIKALFAKMPAGTTPAQFAAFVQAATTVADDAFTALQADIAADQAAHPITTQPAAPAA